MKFWQKVKCFFGFHTMKPFPYVCGTYYKCKHCKVWHQEKKK